MNILITSGGRLATLLYRALKDEHDVRVMRRVADEAFGSSCFVGDVGCYDDVAGAMQDRDCVFHTAVRNNTDIELKSYDEFHHSNVDGTFNVFLAAHRLGVPRVVHSSTSMVFPFHVAGEKMHPDRGAATRCADGGPRLGVDVYGLTKVVGELYADYYRQRYGLSIISLRYGWLAPLEMYRDPAMICHTLAFCFHEQDALTANLLVMNQDTVGNYLICAPPAWTESDAEDLWQNPVAALARRFPDEAAYFRSIDFTPAPIAAWLDCSAAIRDLGYRPQHDFEWFVRAHQEKQFG